MKYSNNQSGAFDKNMYNRLLDEYGDSDITNGSGEFVYPHWTCFHNVLLMMNNSTRIDEELAIGTACRGLCIN